MRNWEASLRYCPPTRQRTALSSSRPWRVNMKHRNTFVFFMTLVTWPWGGKYLQCFVKGNDFSCSDWSTGKKYPFYGVQWHPEVNRFQWHPQYNFPHSKNAVHVSSLLAQFLVNEGKFICLYSFIYCKPSGFYINKCFLFVFLSVCVSFSLSSLCLSACLSIHLL